MKELAILLRCLQLFAHNAHQLASKPTFFSDHAFLGEVYLAAENDYDSVVERLIGTAGLSEADLLDIQIKVVMKLKAYPPSGENVQFIKAILSMEQEMCSMIKQIVPSVSEGTKQLIGEIANQSEIRQYKEKQRLK